MMAALNDLPAKTPVVLHACCHNPTGLDLTPEQWRDVAETLRGAGNYCPFLDFAYQGFAEGPEPDAYAIRLFAESGLSFLVAQSFSKSFSLYGERIGSLTFVTRERRGSEAGFESGETHQFARIIPIPPCAAAPLSPRY